jgi:hypothetical protein
VYLLGTEYRYHNHGLSFEGQPNLIGGFFHWEWWNLVEAEVPV